MTKKQRLSGKAGGHGLSVDKLQSFDQALVETFLGEVEKSETSIRNAAKRVADLSGEKFKAFVSLSQPGEVVVEVPLDKICTLKDVTSGLYREKRQSILNEICALSSEEDLKLASIQLAVTLDNFPASKLSPNESNMKAGGQSTSSPQASPFYNSFVAHDFLRGKHEEFLAKAATKNREFGHAMTLVNEWVRRNQPQDTLGPFPASILHLFLASIILDGEGGQVWSKVSSFQLLKRALKWIVANDLVGDENNGDTRVCAQLSNMDEDRPEQANYSDAEFLKRFPVVVVDPTGFLNLAYSTLPSSYSLLRTQAKQALETDDEELLLMSRISSFARFDLVIKIPLPSPPKSTDEFYSAAEERHACADQTWSSYVMHKLDNLVHRGLVVTERIKRFGLFHHQADATQSVLLGLNLDPEKAFRLVDRGPAADDEIAAGQFRALWGSKAELRRFKDGSIVEAVVWEDVRGKRQIPMRIINHLLSIHAPFDRKHQQMGGCKLLAQGLESIANIDVEDESCRLAMRLTQLVEASIRNNATALPLPIADVLVANTPAVRYTGFVPSVHVMAFGAKDVVGRNNAKKVLKSSKDQISRLVPITGEILIKFEPSSRWPDDAEARHKLENVLLVELARNLERNDSIKLDMDDANEEEQQLFPDCVVSTEGVLDVLAKGYAFRIKIARGKEDDRASRLQALIHTLHHRAETGASRSLGMTARLARRWVSGQRFSSVLGDATLDLIVTSIFIQSFPLEPPRGSLCGLLRVLDLIANFDWARRPLLVDLVDFKPWSKEAREKADKAFFSQRANGSAPPIVIYVRTKHDADDDLVFQPYRDPSTHLSDDSLLKLVQRARETKVFLLKLCEMSASGGQTELDDALWGAIFASDQRSGFDCVLHLADLAKMFPTPSKFDVVQYQNLASMASRQALIGLDPVNQLVAELRLHFGRVAEFFVGSASVPSIPGASSIESIGVMFRPMAKAPVSFKLGVAKLNSPQDDDPNRLEINMEEIADEMARVGRGLIPVVEMVQ